VSVYVCVCPRDSTPTVLTVSVDTWHDKSCVLLLLLLLLKRLKLYNHQTSYKDSPSRVLAHQIISLLGQKVTVRVRVRVRVSVTVSYALYRVPAL